MTKKDRQGEVALIVVALAAVAARLLPAALIHLTEDEAYYRLWSEHLQFGYYDHPPMIAYWIWAGRLLLGDGPLAIRLLPLLSTGVCTWLVGDLARRLGAGGRTALRAAVWYNATLTIGLGGLLATPDAPTSLFWMTTVWSLARPGPLRLGDWALAGLAAGLACLSKYSGFFIAPGVLLWLGADAGRRRQLLGWGPWIAALLAVGVFAPNLLWNAQHGWLTFAKQLGRATVGGLRPGGPAAFLLTQFVLLNPFVALELCGAVAWTVRNRGTALGEKLQLPLLTSLPFFAYLLVHSLHDTVQAHWPAPLFGPLVVCAAVAGVGVRIGSLAVGRAATAFGIGVAMLALAHLALPKVGSWGVWDPARPLVGWREFSRQVEGLRSQERAAWIGVVSYGLASQLQAEGFPPGRVMQINERARYWTQDTGPDLQKPGLVVDLDRRISETELRRCFATVRPAGNLERGFKAGPVDRYTAFVVGNPRRDVWQDGCHFRGEVLPRW